MKIPGNNAPNVDWNEVKALHDAGNSYRGISRQLKERGIKVSHVAIKKRADKECWNGEHKPVTAKVLTVEKAVNLETNQARSLAGHGLKTETRVASILACIAKGMSPSNAAATCGISPSTMSYWRKTDEALEEQIVQARHAYLGSRESNIDEAGNRGDLRANLAILERAPESAEYWQPKGTQGGTGPSFTINLNIGDPKPVEAPTITITPNASKD